MTNPLEDRNHKVITRKQPVNVRKVERCCVHSVRHSVSNKLIHTGSVAMLLCGYILPTLLDLDMFVVLI